MPRGHREEAQTLVEMALVLPLMVLLVAVGVQLVCFCHNGIALQMMALRSARDISIESPALAAKVMYGELEDDPDEDDRYHDPDELGDFSDNDGY